MTKKSFLQGAVVLGVAGLIIKVLGAVFRFLWRISSGIRNGLLSNRLSCIRAAINPFNGRCSCRYLKNGGRKERHWGII